MSTIRVGGRPLFQLRPRDDSGIVDLTGATNLKIVLRKPGGATVELAADLVDGYIEARPSVSDINRAGRWEAYAKFTLVGVEHPTLGVGFSVVPA